MNNLLTFEKTIRQNPTLGIYSLKIATKEKKKELLIPNIPQILLWKYYQEYLRLIILKARQEGVSTEIQAFFFLDTIFTPNTNTVIVSHEKKSTERMFKRTRNFYLWMKETFPPSMIPSVDQGYMNKGELYFPEINSSMFIGTAGADSFGRGDVIHNLHLSEVSSYKGQNIEETIGGLMEAVPVDGRIVIESTPRGIGNEFHSTWIDSYNSFTKVLLPWFLHLEYRFTKEQFERFVRNPELKYPTIDNLTEEEIDLIQMVAEDWQMTLDLEQIAWRRWKKADRKRLFKQEYVEDDITCFLVSKSDVFDNEKIQKLIKTQAKNPIEILEQGQLKIWKNPVKDHSYNMGVDTSEGDINSDYACAKIIDLETDEIVAVLHGRFRDNVLAHKCAQLGQLYNWSMIAIERNNHGHSVINSLLNQEKYPNIYEHDDKKLGFLTTASSKAILLTSKSGLVNAVEDGELKIYDKEFYRECFTFEYKGTKSGGSMGAMKGSYDDRIMAGAIAWITRNSARIARGADGKRLMVA